MLSLLLIKYKCAMPIIHKVKISQQMTYSLSPNTKVM